MTTPRTHPAYSLEVLVTDDQMKRMGEIVATGPARWASASLAPKPRVGFG